MARWSVRLAMVSVLVVVSAGCGSGSPEAGGSPSASPRSVESRSVESPAPAPWAPVPGLGRCGPQPAQVAEQDHRPMTLRGAGRTMPAVATGRGRTVVVLVHQTDGDGLCGWLPFAARIASVAGQTALAFDLCGYGVADCAAGNSTTAARQVEQVRLAIDVAQQRLHARRIVLVGASMGGSLAVLTAAADRRVDAVVDLSGPDDWRGMRVSRQAAGVRVPLLVAMADSEGSGAVAAARATVDAAAPGGAFLGAESGHGYLLLEDSAGSPTPIAERVLDWIAAG